eukprot:1442357-Prymnesium_polylepis.1
MPASRAAGQAYSNGVSGRPDRCSRPEFQTGYTGSPPPRPPSTPRRGQNSPRWQETALHLHLQLRAS